jgi:hypothetical protein
VWWPRLDQVATSVMGSARGAALCGRGAWRGVVLQSTWRRSSGKSGDPYAPHQRDPRATLPWAPSADGPYAGLFPSVASSAKSAWPTAR